ncbi:MAG: DNA-processing protein DprA [Bauldia sp.]|nr:DNA-processing protein DprA [Bauldia sp.]
MSATVSDDERLAALRLIRTESVGPITFRELVDHFGSAVAALDALPELSRRAGRRLRIASAADVERELEALAAQGGRLVIRGEEAYPPWLAAIDSAPPVLAIRGDVAVLARPMVAIVGSRNASVSGRRIAATLARDLGARGLAIASGLARGIDAAAQEAALDAGTVAVLAGGLDRIYPPENQPLAERILAARGAHLSEMPLGWEPRARDFPRRNRIVSGLALGVVVVEAAERSGTLITARFAGEQGRVVFAVPGSPLDPRAAGTNRLIKEGATLVTAADDIVPALEPMLREPLAAAPRSVAEPHAPMLDAAATDRDRVLEALGPAPVAIDEVIRFTGLSAGVVQLVLIELSLAGRIERHPGQRVSLQAPA